MADPFRAETAVPTSIKEPGRVVVFTGPKEGVGKTTTCLNLALAWAGSQNRKVVIVHMDPMCRNDLNFVLGVNPPTLASMVQLVGENPTGGLGRLLKGRIPISQWGVGLLPLAANRQEFQKLTPNMVVKILGSLAESYDLFLDVDPCFPMQIFSFDLADLIYWVCLPQRSHFEATYSLFNEIKTLHFALDKFEVVVNQANLPGALAPKEVDRFFNAIAKRVLAYMPCEDLMPEYANTEKILVVEQLQSDWVKSLRVLLGRMMEIKPTVKHWESSMDAEEFSSSADILWKSAEAPSAESAKPASAVMKNTAPVPDFWDELKGKMHKLVVSAMETERIRISDDANMNQENHAKVSQIIENLLQREQSLALSRAQREQFTIELVDEILGLGPLQQLLRDPAVNEIMVNAYDKIYIEKKGQLVLLPMRFRNDEQVVQVIKRIVAPVGRRIDESVPLVDARLKDGSRVNAIISPLAVSGPTLTIRRFSAKPFTHEQLVKFGSTTPGIVDFLRAAVIIKKNILISGGTGTGKTTFLNMLSNFIPNDERIITVEDTAELRLLAEHWIRLESRPPNIEGKGEITIRDLIKNCLRMRPDRIVVGECRGGESLDMLQAMNTGHEGSLATLHANTPADAISRLSAMCLMAGTDLPMNVLIDMISSAVNLFIQITRFADGRRRTTYVTECVGRDGVKILTKDIFRFVQTWMDDKGTSYGYFTACDYVPRFFEEIKLKGLAIPKEAFMSERTKKKNGLPNAIDELLKAGLPVPDDAEAVAMSHGSGGH
ncbi:MAG: Flp pilus assembly complex ATPase component TadA [Elusimicrobia bacterium]|nr:Flp pilus assembly complex ATPase component TadA [Elusimicrobiota bacterium]